MGNHFLQKRNGLAVKQYRHKRKPLPCASVIIGSAPAAFCGQPLPLSFQFILIDTSQTHHFACAPFQHSD